MTPWAKLQDDFARYARLYGLTSIALGILRYVDRFQFSWDQLWQCFLPSFDVLNKLAILAIVYSPFSALRYLADIKTLLSLAQLGLLAVIVFWLLTKVLPVVIASLPARKLARSRPETDVTAPAVKQSSPWTVVLTMTICLVASFHIIGRLIAYAFASSGNYQVARWFVTYPEMIALGLSVLGIAWSLLRTRGATDTVGRRMGVTILPDDHELTQRVHRMAAQLNLPPPIVGTMKQYNAYAIGSKPGDAAVVIGEPLLSTMTTEEIDAVIGHELGHIASNDMRRMMMADTYQAVIGGFLGILMSLPARALSRNRSQVQISQLFYVLGRTMIAGVSELIVKRLSRAREYVADRTGAMLTSPEAMMGALDKVNNSRARYTPEENKYGYLMFRSGMKGSLLATHPTFEQRRESLINFADDLEERGSTAFDEAQASPFLSAPALATSLKVLAAMALIALGVSYIWSEAALNQAREARQDRIRSETALAAASARASAGDAALVSKQRQIQAEGEGLKIRQAAAERSELSAAQRIKEADDAAARAKAEVAKLEDLRRTPRSSYQVATAEPSAPPLPPPATTPSGFQTATVYTTLPSTVAPTKPPGIPQPTVTQCDQLAANPTDPQRTVADAGVSFPVLLRNSGPAIAACEESSAANPGSATQKYQLARALYAANRRDPRAEQIFADLVNRNYAASFDNLGQIYRNRGDIQNAARVYRLGVNAGDPDSMISLADLIRENKIAPRVENEGDYLYDLAASNGHKNAQKDVEERRARGAAIQTGVVVLKGLLGLR